MAALSAATALGTLGGELLFEVLGEAGLSAWLDSVGSIEEAAEHPEFGRKYIEDPTFKSIVDEAIASNQEKSPEAETLPADESAAMGAAPFMPFAIGAAKSLAERRETPKKAAEAMERVLHAARQGRLDDQFLIRTINNFGLENVAEPFIKTAKAYNDGLLPEAEVYRFLHSQIPEGFGARAGSAQNFIMNQADKLLMEESRKAQAAAEKTAAEANRLGMAVQKEASLGSELSPSRSTELLDEVAPNKSVAPTGLGKGSPTQTIVDPADFFGEDVIDAGSLRPSELSSSRDIIPTGSPQTVAESAQGMANPQRAFDPDPKKAFMDQRFKQSEKAGEKTAGFLKDVAEGKVKPRGKISKLSRGLLDIARRNKGKTAVGAGILGLTGLAIGNMDHRTDEEKRAAALEAAKAYRQQMIDSGLIKDPAEREKERKALVDQINKIRAEGN